jgi:hypothetical protein
VGISGIFVSAFGLTMIALHFASKQKAEVKPQHVASAISVDLSGNNASMDDYHKRMIESVMRHYEGQS